MPAQLVLENHQHNSPYENNGTNSLKFNAKLKGSTGFHTEHIDSKKEPPEIKNLMG